MLQHNCAEKQLLEEENQRTEFSHQATKQSNKR